MAVKLPMTVASEAIKELNDLGNRESGTVSASEQVKIFRSALEKLFTSNEPITDEVWLQLVPAARRAVLTGFITRRLHAIAEAQHYGT